MRNPLKHQFIELLVTTCILSFIQGVEDAGNTTTTTATTTTSATTTVEPYPLVPQYQVMNGSDICLLIQMNLKFSIKYFTTKGDEATSFFYINGSSGTPPTSSGYCTDSTESLRLEWWPETLKESWSLGMRFEKGPPDHFSLNLVQFNFTVTQTLFPDTNETSRQYTARNASQFKCPIGSYFQCMAKQTLKLSSVLPDPTPIETYVTISDLKVEGFRASAKPTFLGTMDECQADLLPNKVVPIVVGVALACMIVIALVAFIVASRRRQNGYQTII